MENLLDLVQVKVQATTQGEAGTKSLPMPLSMLPFHTNTTSCTGDVHRHGSTLNYFDKGGGEKKAYRATFDTNPSAFRLLLIYPKNRDSY